MFFSISVALSEKKESEEGKIQCISALAQVFAIEKEAGNYLRLVNALGNLMYNFEEGKDLAK